MAPVTRSHSANSENIDHPDLQALLNAAAEEEANPESHRRPDIPESSNVRTEMPLDELPAMPKSWEIAI